ncbi:MAG: hypothetical protein ACE5GN_05630 [Waddliaceae bacterium]
MGGTRLLSLNVICQEMVTDSSRCIHCGVGEVGPDNCVACSWPYSEKGWSNFQMGLRRITIDTNCINVKQASGPLNLLERWAKEGKIEIQKSTPFSLEAQGNLKREAKEKRVPGHPPLFTLGSSFGGSVLAGPDLRKEIQTVLFPGVTPLSVSQERDVQHLAEHVRTGGHLFVTIDTSDFISGNKEKKLRSLGVWAVTPEKAVELLISVYGWRQNKGI